MNKPYRTRLLLFVVAFMLFTSVRKLVYVFSDAYIDVPLISYLTDSPNIAIYFITGVAVLELILALILLFSKDNFRDGLIKGLLLFVIAGIIYSILELIYFGTSCFCGISSSPVVSMAFKILILIILSIYLYEKPFRKKLYE